MAKMSKLFLNDFYRCKYAHDIAQLKQQEEEDHGERRRALEKLATEVERSEFISKKSFYLRYKLNYGASAKDAQDLFFWIYTSSLPFIFFQA